MNPTALIIFSNLMVTPLPEIPSDVLSLLEGYFTEMEVARLGLLRIIEKYRADIGELRREIWTQGLLAQNGGTVFSIHCDECQDEPYGLAVWPIGRGQWACQKHYDLLKEKGLL